MNYLIQAVPEREGYVQYLTRRLPEAQVFWDREAAPLPAFRATLLQGEPYSSTLFLQDDVLLCRNFREEAQQRIAEFPDLVQQFFCHNYVFRGSTKKERAAGRYIAHRQGKDLSGLLCVYLPAGMLTGFTEFLFEVISGYPPDDFLTRFPELKNVPAYQWGTDTLLGHYLYATHRPFITWTPGLVQHRVGVSFKSRHKPMNRTTSYYIDAPPWNGSA